MRIYITGVSQGIGKALALELLSNGNTVIGFGRNNTIEHACYTFVYCDLNDLNSLQKIQFEADEEGAVLINNAGIIGPLTRISDQDRESLLSVMTVNTLAPMLLCQQFLKQVSQKTRAVIVNISSGAANRPIPSWASYCASKIALDRFSETICLEELEKGRNLAVYSIAPGVVDTPMQTEIRSADPEHFSSLNTFQELFKNKELTDPSEVAKKLASLLFMPFDGKVIRSVREF